MYISKAGSLLQGGVHFDLFLNCGICQFLMVSGKMKGPLRADPFRHLREGYSKCSLPYCDLVLCLVVVVVYDVFSMEGLFLNASFHEKVFNLFPFFISYFFMV